MKTLFASALLLSFAALASAQTFKAITVSNVARTGDNVYTAEKYTNDTHGEASAADMTYRYITFKTGGCKHSPAVGATAIYLRSSDGSNDKLIFSDGGACAVNLVESTDTAPKK
jgi:hypothetical protein